MHPVKALWERHQPSEYPTGVEPVPQRIPGLAFFPGGAGLWAVEAERPLPPFPVGGVMVLGHDFHSRKGYDKSFGNGAESKSMPTWRNLVPVLEAGGVSLESCFFTNFYMGLRSGTKTTGKFPGAGDPPFVAHCERFFLRQLDAQRPALIITLGVHVPKAISGLSEELGDWSAVTNLKELDARPVRSGVTFRGMPSYQTTIVALTHPSQRGLNVRRRRYCGIAGADAEVAMLRQAIQHR